MLNAARSGFAEEKHRVMELLLLQLPPSLSLSLPAASRSDTGVRLSSPGEVEKIVEGAEGWGCVWICTEYGCKHVLFLKE